MSDVDSEVLEKILDPATSFVERRRAFDEAMTWAQGEGWDACEAAYRQLHGPIAGPTKPDGMVIPDRPVVVLAPAPTWSVEEVPVIDGHAIRHSTRADGPIVRVPVRSTRG